LFVSIKYVSQGTVEYVNLLINVGLAECIFTLHWPVSKIC